jgi:hypothetical protein
MDDAEIYDSLKSRLIPLGFESAATEFKMRWGKCTGPGWRMFPALSLGYINIMWSTPEDHETIGQHRPFEDMNHRLSQLGAIHAALKPFGYEGEIKIRINDTPCLIITRIPTA